MIPQFQVLAYSFDKSPSENLQQALRTSAAVNGEFAAVFFSDADENGYWDTYAQVNVDGTMRGIDMAHYIKNIYDGTVPACLVEKIFREVGRLIYNIGDAVGLGDLGCAIGGFLDDIGLGVVGNKVSIICTAVTESVDSGSNVLETIKKFSVENIMDTEDGMAGYREYLVVGKKIVDKLNSIESGSSEYRYLYNTFVIPVYDISVDLTLNKEDKLKKFLVKYFEMLDYLVDKYEIKVSSAYTKKRIKYGM